MDAGIDGEERDLIAVGILEGDEAEVIAIVDGGDSGQGAGVVPFHGDVIGEDEVEDAGAEADEDGVIAGGTAHFAGAVGGLELDAAAAEVADGLGPDGGPELAKLRRGAAGAESMMRWRGTRRGAGAVERVAASAAAEMKSRRVTPASES